MFMHGRPFNMVKSCLQLLDVMFVVHPAFVVPYNISSMALGFKTCFKVLQHFYAVHDTQL